jgi:hypothetical protein
VEPDQHSSFERGAGKGAGDHAPHRGDDLTHEAQAIPEPPPTEEEAHGVVEPATPDPAPLAEPEPGARPDVIMSKLPRTRPQRVTGRRHRDPAPALGQTAPSQKSGSAQRTAAPGRPKSRAGTAARAAKQGTAARATPARAGGPAGTRRAAPPPPRRTSPTSEPATRRGGSGGAPGLPRLAMEGAVEAAKLPLKVGGRLTLRALDAVARGLRGG